MPIPNYVSKLPQTLRVKWEVIFNKIASTEGENVALIAANEWLKRQISVKDLTAKTEEGKTITSIQFKLADKQLVKKTIDGEEYVDFVLTDSNAPDVDGNTYSPKLLKEWEQQINGGDILVGDIDHKEFDLFAGSTSDAEAAAMLIKKAKKGIAKTVKAMFKKGKLFVRAIIDKRYKRLIEGANGVSLEAFVEKNDDGEYDSGDLLGFTFAVNQQRAHGQAVII